MAASCEHFDAFNANEARREDSAPSLACPAAAVANLAVIRSHRSLGAGGPLGSGCSNMLRPWLLREHDVPDTSSAVTPRAARSGGFLQVSSRQSRADHSEVAVCCLQHWVHLSCICLHRLADPAREVLCCLGCSSPHGAAAAATRAHRHLRADHPAVAFCCLQHWLHLSCICLHRPADLAGETFC